MLWELTVASPLRGPREDMRIVSAVVPGFADLWHLAVKAMRASIEL